MPPLIETNRTLPHGLGKNKGPTTINLTSSVHHRAIWRILFWRFRASLAYLQPVCIRHSSPLPPNLVLSSSYPGQSPLSISPSVPLGLSLSYRHWLALGIDLGTGFLPRPLSSGHPLYLPPRVRTELAATRFYPTHQVGCVGLLILNTPELASANPPLSAQIPSLVIFARPDSDIDSTQTVLPICDYSTSTTQQPRTRRPRTISAACTSSGSRRHLPCMGIPPYLRPTYPWLSERRFACSLFMSDPPDPSCSHGQAPRARRSLDAHQELITFPHTAPGRLQRACPDSAHPVAARASSLGSRIVQATDAHCGRTHGVFMPHSNPRSARRAYPQRSTAATSSPLHPSAFCARGLVMWTGHCGRGP